MFPHKGKWAEEEALKFYIKRGYRLIGKNIRGYGGEIDIVMFKNGHVILVEVKHRKYSEEDALLSVSTDKKRRILRTWYAKGGEFLKYPFSLEVCVLVGTRENYSIKIYREEL